jgi:hypothetical protein
MSHGILDENTNSVQDEGFFIPFYNSSRYFSYGVIKASPIVLRIFFRMGI